MALNLWQAKHDKRGLNSKPPMSFIDRYARLGNYYENEASTLRVTPELQHKTPDRIKKKMHIPIVGSTGTPAHARTSTITINPTESVPLYTETSLNAAQAHTANSSVTRYSRWQASM